MAAPMAPDVSARPPRESRPLVSVVMPYLHAARFLDEAIQSVASQTYERWELLLVDDGSTDGSERIAASWARRQPGRIHCLRHPGGANRGISASRNLGLRSASGELVAFLDADDVWREHKLERHVALLSAHPEAGMVYGRTEYWHSWTGDRGDAGRDHVARGADSLRVLRQRHVGAEPLEREP